MSLLLTHGYFIDDDIREKGIMKPYPPLGLLYISAYLKKHKIEHDLFDSTFSSKQQLLSQIQSKKYAQIAFYVNMMTKISVLEIIKFIRSQEELKETMIILGGPDVRYNAENYIEHGADVIVLGEGEETMVDLISTLNTPLNPFLDKVNGIAFKNYFGKAFFTEEREKIKLLDELPFPNREGIDLNKYLQVWKKHHGHSAININTQRGCPYTCRWCSTAVYGQSYRRRSAESVCDELEQLVQKFNPDTFWFVDDVFTVSHKWLAGFADEIERRNIKIKYECITRADRMNDEVIKDLKRSGCYRVWIGAESGSQNIIDKMDRRVDVNVVSDMIQKTRSEGIETGTFIMLGYPGETLEDINATIDHLVKSNPHHFTITTAYPIKGTELYEEVEDRMIGSYDWSTSTDRDIDFKRTYPKEFYPAAVQYVTNEVRLRHYSKIGRLVNPKAWIHKIKSIRAQEKMSRYRPLDN